MAHNIETWVNGDGSMGMRYATPTAGTTQTQAGATALTGVINVVACGNKSDGVKLPIGEEHQVVIVKNAETGDKDVNVYPPVGGTLDGGEANAAVAQGENTTYFYVCTAPLTWVTAIKLAST